MSRRREYDLPAATAYPPDPWHIRELHYIETDHQKNETIFCVGNGYIGIRGFFEEGFQGTQGISTPGIFLNGFFERKPIHYPENAYGFARYEDTMLNVTNCVPIRVEIDGEELGMWGCTMLEYERRLDMQAGLMTRAIRWRTPKGREATVVYTRMCSLANKHLATLHVAVTAHNFSGTVRITSTLDGAVTNIQAKDDPRVGSNMQGQVLCTQERTQDGTFAAIRQRTIVSQFTLVCAMENSLEGGVALPLADPSPEDQKLHVAFEANVADGHTVELTKYVAYVASKDYSEADLLQRARQEVTAAKAQGFAKLVEQQRGVLDKFWANADVEINGDPHLQQGLRFNCFHLFQSLGRDGRTNIAAKGLTGEGYGGHYFWDTEVYILPFFLYTNPDFAKPLIQFRYSLLPKARERARELSIKKGALYPWRTICGDECSAYFPAGTAQVHINADIVYALKCYVEATGDEELLLQQGAEMAFEIARMWVTYGTWVGEYFHIHGVTGPDEYTAIVDNNFYTNVMAQMSLQFAYNTAVGIRHDHPDHWQRLTDLLELDAGEPDQWLRAADRMYLPHDKVANVHPQDDSFLKKRPWDFENTPKENYPLLMHYHPMVIYKHRVCKQADLVLAQCLLGNLFSLDEKRADYDFYEPLTTHDSSLSTAIFSIMASELGYHHKAFAYFVCTARMDLDNAHHNVQHGVHTACMAGTWLCVVKGFGGMRVYDKVLHFDPHLPEGWDDYTFTVSFRGCRLRVKVEEGSVSYTLLEGKLLRFIHSQHSRVTLRKDRSVTLPIRDRLMEISTLEFDGVVFEMDTFIEDISREHFEAWKQVLDQFVAAKAAEQGREIPLLTHEAYMESIMHTVTKENRYAGLAGYLESLGLTLQLGSSDDPPTAETLSGLGNAKLRAFREIVEAQGVRVDQRVVALIKDIRENGIGVACTSYSKNCTWLLQTAGLHVLFDTVVDGLKAGQLGLKGKPAADIFLHACQELGSAPKRCVLVVGDVVGYHATALAPFKYCIAKAENQAFSSEPGSPSTATTTTGAGAGGDSGDYSLATLGKSGSSGAQVAFATADRVCPDFAGVTTDLLEHWLGTGGGSFRKRTSSFARTTTL
eukprot:TRINITY_DN2901_c0_g1_i1.p1 TRINITY_DN2901_c0_g1~~TRINITY_DN2901_c0_g1_i1.p1  ORF type:complete len:1108 (-),score=264.30 TRINITY_DN2901_c0_g1_i1:491-3790(-)